MSLKSKIAFNTSYQLISKLVTSLTTLIGTALITRLLGANTFGEYSIVLAYTTTYYIIADFGINAIVIKDFAKDELEAKNRFGSLLLFRILYGIIIVIIAASILFLFPYPQFIKNAILVSLPLVIFSSIAYSANAIFQSYLKYKLQTISTIVGSVIGLGLLITAVTMDNTSLFIVVLAVVVGSSISPIFSLFLVRNYLSWDLKWFDLKYWRYITIQSFPFGIALILNTLMVQADKLILSVVSTPTSVGIYSLAYRIFDLVLVVPTFFMNVMYPILIKEKTRDHERYVNLARLSIIGMFFASLVITAIGFLSSTYVVSAIWGKEMINSSIAFNILVMGSFAFFVSAPISWIILIEQKQKTLPIIYGLALSFNVILNLIFIPKYDYIAAGAITVITECLVVLMLMFVVR